MHNTSGVEVQEETRRCSHCNEKKSVHFFNPHQWARPIGNKAVCRSCKRAYNRLYDNGLLGSSRIKSVPNRRAEWR